MARDHTLPKRLGLYLRRLSIEYEHAASSVLKTILQKARIRVVEETNYDNWDGGTWGHDVVFYLEPEDLGLVPLHDQDEIAERIKNDLNKASSSIQGEWINAVHFEFLDENDPDAQTAGLIQRPPRIDPNTLSFWEPDHIRLFITHRDTHKSAAHALADELKYFGISAFVAHDTIEPDEEWQREIERALQSMEVMLALITDDFHESTWTNQEVGFALGSGIPVINLKLGNQDPLGFIGKRQAIKGNLRRPTDCCDGVFRTIAKRLGGTSKRIGTAAITGLINARSFEEAKHRFKTIEKFDRLEADEVLRLIEGFRSNQQLYWCHYLGRDGNLVKFLERTTGKQYRFTGQSVEEIGLNPSPADLPDDEIPF